MRPSRMQKVLWVTAGAATLVWASGIGLVGWGAFSDATQVEAFRPGFALPDAEGRVVSSEDLRGRYQLVFFGFTNCPDVCPTTLSEVAQVMDDLGEDAARVQPLFISVDPERDRALGLAEYTAAFHPSILGLAGSDEATQAAADSFKTFYGREAQEDAPDGYSMFHSSGLYLIGPEGDWLRQFTYGTSADEIVADLKSRL